MPRATPARPKRQTAKRKRTATRALKGTARFRRVRLKRKGPKRRRTVPSGFKCFLTPRPNKKLLVLDIDGTLYAYTNILRMATRPHLQEFLTGIYPYYDLAYWSSISMEYIEKKAKAMDTVNKTNYKFLFYVDITATAFVRASGMGLFETKPLIKIYERFNQFNEKNTLICDDQDNNFYYNPRNGIEVSEFSIRNRNTDRELLLLKQYLIRIAEEEDVSALDHHNWRESVEEDESEGGSSVYLS